MPGRSRVGWRSCGRAGWQTFPGGPDGGRTDGRGASRGNRGAFRRVSAGGRLGRAKRLFLGRRCGRSLWRRRARRRTVVRARAGRRSARRYALGPTRTSAGCTGRLFLRVRTGRDPGKLAVYAAVSAVYFSASGSGGVRSGRGAGGGAGRRGMRRGFVRGGALSFDLRGRAAVLRVFHSEPTSCSLRLRSIGCLS